MAQVLDIRGITLRDVRHQPNVSRHILTRDNCGLVHGAVPKQACLNLTQLNAQSTDLDLSISTTEEIERSIFPPPTEITGGLPSHC
jgi:hypothetical protein